MDGAGAIDSPWLSAFSGGFSLCAGLLPDRLDARLRITMSTRRFWARSSSVSLSVTGWYSAYPAADNLFGVKLYFVISKGTGSVGRAVDKSPIIVEFHAESACYRCDPRCAAHRVKLVFANLRRQGVFQFLAPAGQIARIRRPPGAFRIWGRFSPARQHALHSQWPGRC